MKQPKTIPELVAMIRVRLGDVPAHYIAIRAAGTQDWTAQMNGSEDVVAAYQPRLEAICADLRRRYSLAL